MPATLPTMYKPACHHTATCSMLPPLQQLLCCLYSLTSFISLPPPSPFTTIVQIVTCHCHPFAISTVLVHLHFLFCPFSFLLCCIFMDHVMPFAPKRNLLAI